MGLKEENLISNEINDPQSSDEEGSDVPDEYDVENTNENDSEEEFESGESSDDNDADTEEMDEESENEAETHSGEESDESSVGEKSDDASEESSAEKIDEEEGNAGWADAMAKVLAMGKNSDKTVSLLSKAKKDNVKKKTVSTGVKNDSEDDDHEQEVKTLEPLAIRKAKKREIDSIGRKIPNVLERNAERALTKIATRGVVQLFNAVREQQKDIKTQLKAAGGSFRKQEKVFKNIDKNSFVELLTGKSISKPSEEPSAKKAKTIEEDPEENQPSWNILRDDFMLGAKMRDWDKESDED